MGADLLEMLDAFVRSDPRPPGFVGDVVLGVGERFWRASFGAEIETEFLSECPDESDAMLVLAPKDARAILEGRVLSGATYFSGERAMMKKFLDRYLAARSPA